MTSQPCVSWPFPSPQGRGLQTRPWKPSPALGPLAEGLGPPQDVDRGPLCPHLHQPCPDHGASPFWAPGAISECPLLAVGSGVHAHRAGDGAKAPSSYFHDVNKLTNEETVTSHGDGHQQQRSQTPVRPRAGLDSAGSRGGRGEGGPF